MGATTFTNTIAARTADEGYRTLVAEARDEYGRGGYTGTIAETRGFRRIELRSGETIDACIERITETASGSAAGAKWGPAACLELGPDAGRPGLTRFMFFGWAAC